MPIPGTPLQNFQEIHLKETDCPKSILGTLNGLRKIKQCLSLLNTVIDELHRGIFSKDIDKSKRVFG